MLWRYGPGNGDQDWSLPGLASDRVPQQSCQDPALEGDTGTHSQTPREGLIFMAAQGWQSIFGVSSVTLLHSSYISHHDIISPHSVHPHF
jgi:hypothetical protein